MAMEIERKFLVRSDDWRAQASPGVSYRQGYLATNEHCSIRIRIGADGAMLNIKGATVGVSRAEFEVPVPPADAEQILDTLCRRPIVEKVRFHVPFAGHVWEVDVFSGDNDGLVVAEIELRSEDEAFERPPWLGAEVSDDVRYYNARLAVHPFREWGGQ